MDTSKIIRGVVSNGRYTVTAPIVKEDYGLYLQIEGVELPEAYQVDFSNDEHNGTSVTMIGNSDGVLIPRQFIDSGKDIFAFLYHVGEDFGRTIYKFRIPNKVRPDRTDEEPTPEEQSVIDQTIDALNEAVESAQENADFLRNATATATSLSPDSEATVMLNEGEFAFGIPKGSKGDRGEPGAKGEPGEKGNPGTDGVSPTVSVTDITGGHRVAITDKTGTKNFDVMNGNDYVLTEQDKADIAEMVNAPVDDVQINGSSIVTDGVANVPIASRSHLGVVKVVGNGVWMVDGEIRTNAATTAQIKQSANSYNVIVPDNQKASTFYGLAKAAGHDERYSTLPVGQYTPEAQTAIRTMLGLENVYQDYSSALSALGVI